MKRDKIIIGVQLTGDSEIHVPVFFKVFAS